MMIFFTTIVFIAQIVILVNIVTFLLKSDKKVCVLTEQINKRHVKLKWRMGAIVEITQGINDIFPIILRKIEKTKLNFLLRILNEMLQGTILLFFKPKYKKILLGLKTGIGVTKKLLKI